MEDYERNDGSEEKPYFMSKSLKNLLGVDNKFQTDGGEGTDGAHVEAETVPEGDKLTVEPVESDTGV